MALTIPAVRKIRARYVAGKCNAALGFKLRDNYAAAQPYELVDELVFTQAGVSISRENTHSCDYAHDVCALRQGERRVCGVELIKDEASTGAGQAVQSEGIPVFSQESPYPGLFPTPAPPQSFQSERGAHSAELHRGRHI